MSQSFLLNEFPFLQINKSLKSLPHDLTKTEAGVLVRKMFVAEGSAGAAAFQSRGKLLHQLKRATTAAAGGSGGPSPHRLRMTQPRCQDASKVTGERGY